LILADTNILLRLFLQDDPKQFKAVERHLSHLKRSHQALQVHTLAVAETVWVLERKGWSREAITDALLELCESESFQVIELDPIRAALKIYFEGRLSFVDAFQAAYVAKLGLQGILSFDRDYDGLGVRRVEP
jgi:predicted nucleic-acid-binding protein